jgi:hypothetical protein
MPDAICAAHHKTIVSRIESSKPANLKQCGGSEILRGAGGGEMSETQRLSRLRVKGGGSTVSMACPVLT